MGGGGGALVNLPAEGEGNMSSILIALLRAGNSVGIVHSVMRLKLSLLV